MKKEVTKQELVETIMAKTKKAKPQVRKIFADYLKYQTKALLKKINSRVKVTRGDISWD